MAVVAGCAVARGAPDGRALAVADGFEEAVVPGGGADIAGVTETALFAEAIGSFVGCACAGSAGATVGRGPVNGAVGDDGKLESAPAEGCAGPPAAIHTTAPAATARNAATPMRRPLFERDPGRRRIVEGSLSMTAPPLMVPPRSSSDGPARSVAAATPAGGRPSCPGTGAGD